VVRAARQEAVGKRGEDVAATELVVVQPAIPPSSAAAVGSTGGAAAMEGEGWKGNFVSLITEEAKMIWKMHKRVKMAKWR
jgi:hypothetical protein